MAIAAAVDFGTLSVGVSLVLAEYYLWCDHRAKGEAAEITEAAQREGPEAIQWCGGVYSSDLRTTSCMLCTASCISR